MSTATVAETATTTRTIAIPNDGLRQLANVALFASADQAVPVLCAVHLVSDGATLTVEATDRYQAAREVIELQTNYEPDKDSFDVVADVAGIRAAAKIKHGNYSLPVTVTVRDENVTFDNGEGIARATLVDAQFPKLGVFFDPIQGPIDRGNYPDQPFVVGFNPQYLARLAKVRTETGKPPTTMRWTFGQADKPSQVEMGDTFRAVFMPVKVSS